MRMTPLAGLVCGMAVVTLGACAPTHGTRARAASAPYMISRQPPPFAAALVPPSGASRPGRVVFEVAVDSSGRAEVSTLRVVGPQAPSAHYLLVAWLADAQFQPAQRGGRSVRGVYRRELRVQSALVP